MLQLLLLFYSLVEPQLKIETKNWVIFINIRVCVWLFLSSFRWNCSGLSSACVFYGLWICVYSHWNRLVDGECWYAIIVSHFGDNKSFIARNVHKNALNWRVFQHENFTTIKQILILCAQCGKNGRYLHSKIHDHLDNSHKTVRKCHYRKW